MGARRAERGRPAAHRARAPAGRGTGRRAPRAGLRRGAGVTAAAGPPDGAPLLGRSAGPRTSTRGWRRSATRSGTARRPSGRPRPTGSCSQPPVVDRWAGLGRRREHPRLRRPDPRRGREVPPGARRRAGRVRPAGLADRRAGRGASPLVAHAGTNSVFICHLLGLPPTPWEWDRMVLRHASISRLEAIPLGDGYTFSLTALSDVEHLPPPTAPADGPFRGRSGSSGEPAGLPSAMPHDARPRPR